MFLKPAPDSLPPQIGIKQYFFVQRYCFAALGIDLTSLEKPIFNRFLAWIPMILLSLYSFPILLYVSQHIRDMVMVTDALTAFWQIFLSVLKLLVFIWNKNKFVKLIRRIWLKNLEVCNEELTIVSEENRKDTMYAKFYFCMVSSTGCMALLSPIIIACFYYLKGYKFWEYLDTPLKACYFVDTKTFQGYSLIYTWNIISVYCIIGTSVGSDTLFAWFAHNISAQFRIVKLRFDVAANGARSENEMTKSIIACIKYHRDVIDSTDMLNDVYMLTVFIKFTISFLQIACVVYQLSNDTGIFRILYHFMFVVAFSMQLMLYCHSAQQIKDESESVAVAIFDCFKWHELNNKSKKLLLLPMMRSQKPCLISGIFFFIDLPLLLGVFKAAGSLITMLKSLDQGK